MKRWMFPAIALLCLSAYGLAQTVDELVAKNIEAKGGLDKIKAVKTRRMAGRAEPSSLMALLSSSSSRMRVPTTFVRTSPSPA